MTRKVLENQTVPESFEIWCNWVLNVPELQYFENTFNSVKILQSSPKSSICQIHVTYFKLCGSDSVQKCTVYK